MAKHNNGDRPLVSLSIRVEAETADRLKEIADAEYRPVAAHIRRLIEQDIAAHQHAAA